MADIMGKLFTSAPGLHRVDISGLIVMLAGIILLFVSETISKNSTPKSAKAQK